MEKPDKKTSHRRIKLAAWILAAAGLLSIVGIFLSHREKNYPVQAVSDTANVSVIHLMVETFGKTLQSVSLLAPADMLKAQMDKVYGPYLTPALLSQWENQPDTALGREISSPYPDHIDIASIQKNTDGTYTIMGEVVELTSDNLEHGGYTDKYSITLTVIKTDTWRISAASKGPVVLSR